MSQKPSLKELIASGDYYNHALVWYYQKYIDPFAQRAYYLILAIVMSICAYLVIDIYFSEARRIQLPFPIYTDSDLDERNNIIALKGDHNNIDRAVARYLLTNYVTARETYDKSLFEESNWSALQKNMRAFSSLKVYAQYRDYIDIQSNANSPLLAFSRGNRRTIEVKDINFINDTQELARVNFSATINTESGRSQTQNYIADIGYIMTSAESVATEGMKFKFLIISYDVSAI
jgi:type IV secretory pathway component VirB8